MGFISGSKYSETAPYNQQTVHMNQQLLRLGRNAFTYGLGGLLGRFMSLLLLPLFTAYLTPLDYGITGMVGMLNMFLAPVMGLGLGVSTGIVYFEEDDPNRKAEAIGTALFLLTVASAVTLVVCWIWAPQLSLALFQTPQHAIYIKLSVLSACLYNTVGVVGQMFLQFEERSKTFVKLTLVSVLSGILFSLVLVVGMGRGVLGMLESGVLVPLLMMPLYGLQLRRLPLRVRWPIAKELLRLGLPMVPSFGFLFVLMQTGRYLLQYFHGLEAVGIYSIGFNLGMLMDLFVSGFASAWHPYFMSFINKREEAGPLFGRVTTYYCLGMGAITLLFFVLAKPLVLIMTQPAFHEAYRIVGWCATAHFFRGIFLLLLPPVYYSKEVRAVVLVQGVTALVTVGLGWVLISAGGFTATAIVLACGGVLLAVLQFFWNLSRRRNYLDISFEWGRLGSIALVFTMVAGVFSIPRSFQVILEVVIGALGVGLVLVLVWMLMTGQERRMVKSGILVRKPLGFKGDSSKGPNIEG